MYGAAGLDFLIPPTPAAFRRGLGFSALLAQRLQINLIVGAALFQRDNVVADPVVGAV